MVGAKTTILAALLIAEIGTANVALNQCQFSYDQMVAPIVGATDHETDSMLRDSLKELEGQSCSQVIEWTLKKFSAAQGAAS